MKEKWWKEAVVYQIYPRSFMDSNGDGIGDIQGIISKLDYLKNLGINVLWLSPIYLSPNDDNGYDISDYYKIQPEYGTMADFDELLTAVHKRDMRLIMDLVINHTSDEHPWFIASQANKDNPYRDYYIWRQGKNGAEPNNWESIFGGSAWAYNENTDDYFLHVFSKKQPDVNWENEAVRNDLYDMVNWWLNKGIDGFRVDAISHIKKDLEFRNLPVPDGHRYAPSFAGHMNRPGIEKYLNELRHKTFSNYDIMTVGEANGVKIEDAATWVGEDQGIFNMIFQFEHLDLWGISATGGIDIKQLKQTFLKWQKGLEGLGWNALFLENHDQARSVSTWGDDTIHRELAAKSFAAMYFLMQGTPYIYQGQEIGMTNVQFDDIEDYRDVAIKKMYHEAIAQGRSHDQVMQMIWKSGRDNSRTPMQWNNQEEAGFSSGQPWIKVNPNYKDINVARSIEDANSIYHFYKKLIALRKQEKTLIYGIFNLIHEDHPYVFAYERVLNGESFYIYANLFDRDTKLDKTFLNDATFMLSNYPQRETDARSFRPFEAKIYKK